MEDSKAIKEIKDGWAYESKRQFCKQSCTKISQGLDSLDNRSAERAIWELFQNARDLAKENSQGQKEAHIKITVTPTEFIFAHQGRSFTYDSFSSLVKQVSAQEKENEETVGQYGTGFLTTHSFGRRIFVNGSLDLGKYAPGMYVDIDRFEIDRVFDNIETFTNMMAAQLLAIDNYADAPKTTKCREWTELRYQLDSASNAAEKVKKCIEAAVNVMPYVMTINEPIGDVEIVDHTTGKRIHFTKCTLPEEEGLKVLGIRIDEDGDIRESKVYYLQSKDGKDTAILPLSDVYNARNLSGIAKIFVYFPLLGTENFGMDFVFHSCRFYPVTERHALHLPVDDNDNVRPKYEANVMVLNEMSEMVFAYLKEHAGNINGWVDISKISFECERNSEQATNNFFTEFKKKWVKFFMELPIVDVNGNRESIESGNVFLYSQNLIDAISGENKKWSDTLYKAAMVCGELPDINLIEQWSSIVYAWGGVSLDSFLTFEAISKSIQQLDASSAVLKDYDHFISATDHKQLFESYTLIPNRAGTLMRKSQLRDAKDIPDWLCEKVKPFIAEDVEKFVNNEFADLDSFTPYTRKDLRSKLNDAINRIAEDTFRRKFNPTCASRETLRALAQICLVVKSDEADTIQTRTIRVVCDFLGLDYELSVLPPLDSEEVNLADTPLKHLVENLLLNISQQDSEWISSHSSYVYELHSTLSTWAEYYNRNTKSGYATKYAVFPNMLFQPSLASYLNKGLDIDSELMDLYESIMKSDLREQLVSPEYADFCEFTPMSASDVAKEIEDKLEEDGFKNDCVLDIIKMFDDDPKWATLFPHISQQKADIFMKQVREESKESLFRIMKVDDPLLLDTIAEIVGADEGERILRRAMDIATQEKNESADFEYKKKLGEYVEDFLQTQLSTFIAQGVASDESKVEVENNQYGQDLVIRLNDEPIYFIEVKSRWGSDRSVRMTQTQLYTCVEKSDRYALCCVDMSGYDRTNVDEHIYPEVEETIERIKALPNIGSLAKEAFDAMMINEDKVHLDGGFSCVVPQSVIKSNGVSFDELLKIILKKIEG